MDEDDEARDSGDPRQRIAERLDHLFRTVHPKDRKPYTLQEVATAINDKAGKSLVNYSYLSLLRRGKRKAPSPEVLQALADFFGVDLAYFYSDEKASRIDEQLKLAAALRDTDVARIATRAAGLSEQSLRAILAVVENARNLEKLPEDDD